MKKIFISAALLGLCAGAFAQNLNPTEEVTNIYAREAKALKSLPSSLKCRIPSCTSTWTWTIR